MEHIYIRRVPRVNPKFWELRAKYELVMLLFTVEAWKRSPVDTKTGLKRGKLAMNINPN